MGAPSSILGAGGRESGVCFALTRYPEMSKYWNGGDQNMKDDAGDEGSERVLGERALSAFY